MAEVILAVSGGVDSMVMLDLLCPFKISDELCPPEKVGRGVMVAHFDHGIRENSDDDAAFVIKQVNYYYEASPVVGQSELGMDASEDAARTARYGFLHTVARNWPKATGEEPEIYTAHHLDDLIESVAINLFRGTGWRGLAVLDTPGVRRPFLEPELLPEAARELAPFDKKEILRYAGLRKMHFREDPSNSWDEYLRNRIRHQTNNVSGMSRELKLEIFRLWQRQTEIKHEIDELIEQLLPRPGEAWQRSRFQDLDEKVALELLRAGTLRAGIGATRPQLEEFRQAILTYAPSKCFNLPQDHLVKLAKDTFVL